MLYRHFLLFSDNQYFQDVLCIFILLHFWQMKLELVFFSFSSRKLHKNYQMSGKLNSHICLMLSVSESFYQTSNMAGKEFIYCKIYLGLKYKFLWRPVKPVFNNQNPVCRKPGINIPPIVILLRLQDSSVGFGVVGICCCRRPGHRTVAESGSWALM